MRQRTVTNVILTQLRHVDNKEWYLCITKSPKLWTYCTFKSCFEQENYIKILDKSKKSALCKLWISAHKLMIESGRYAIPKIPPENKLCQVCDLQEVEDEFHFIIPCTLLKQPCEK